MKVVIESSRKLIVSFLSWFLLPKMSGGATATIFQALDTNDDTKVALKVMNSMDNPQPAQVKMVKREVSSHTF